MIKYVDRTDDVLPHQLDGFFVGWAHPPSPETHLRLLECSDEALLAMDVESGQVVGFITAITDGVLCAYIPLLEVLPPFQGRGIGSKLMRRMLERLSGFYMVDLVCDPELQTFYESLGMHPAAAMVIRNHQHDGADGKPRAEGEPHQGQAGGK